MSSHSSDWPPPAGVWHSLTDIQPPRRGRNRHNHPTQMIDPDNNQDDITKWNDVLVNVVRWLTKNSHLGGGDCPIHDPDKPDTRYLVATRPIHRDGKVFEEGRRENVNSLYIETNHTASKTVRNTIVIIDHVGMDASQFKVRW